jgi:hypothetical protein
VPPFNTRSARRPQADVARLTLSREKAMAAIQSGAAAPHLVAILRGVIDAGIAYGIVLPHAAGPWRIPTGKPCLLLVGDDLHASHGPSAFDAASIRKFARDCRRAFIIASAPPIALYASAADEAIVGRRNTIIVETRERFEADWLACIERAGRHLAIHLSTSPGEGNA